MIQEIITPQILERLRGSKRAGIAAEIERGRKAGADWAAHRAEWLQLCRLWSITREIDMVKFVEDEHGDADEFLYKAFDPHGNHDDNRYEIMFRKDADLNSHYFAGFVLGAHEFCDEAMDLIDEERVKP
jgi:hypothetical protein